MRSPIKQLAGETAIYGLSTILARLINFLLVPVYTRVLTTGDYGTVTELMSWIGVLQVALVLGLETGCFRFANKEGADPRKVYGNAFVAVFGVSAATFALALAFRGSIAGALGYDGYGAVIAYMGGILAMDSVTAILFAKLRQEHQAVKFAVVKTVKIFTELGCNLWLFLTPSKPMWVYDFVSLTPDFSYVIFSILVSCVLCTLLLVPEFFKISYRLDRKLLRDMLIYSLPLMVAALPGVVNDFLDRILFRWCDTSSASWLSTLGMYQAAVKLSVIMNLFIQMFRYAAEPFFFQRAKDKGSKELYANVMNWFVAFCCLVMLGVVYYIDVLGLLLGRNFRQAIGVVPVMLLSYIFLGMLFNVNMWYKLSGKTSMAVWITLIGLCITAGMNVVFMPRFSYWASAFGHLLSYLTMLIISVLLGNKYYPIPYNWKKIFALFALTAVMLGIGWLIGGTGRMFGGAGWMSGGDGMGRLFGGAGWMSVGTGMGFSLIGILEGTILLLIYCVAAYWICSGRLKRISKTRE